MKHIYEVGRFLYEFDDYRDNLLACLRLIL